MPATRRNANSESSSTTEAPIPHRHSIPWLTLDLQNRWSSRGARRKPPKPMNSSWPFGRTPIRICLFCCRRSASTNSSNVSEYMRAGDASANQGCPGSNRQRLNYQQDDPSEEQHRMYVDRNGNRWIEARNFREIRNPEPGDKYQRERKQEVSDISIRALHESRSPLSLELFSRRPGRTVGFREFPASQRY